MMSTTPLALKKPNKGFLTVTLLSLLLTVTGCSKHIAQQPSTEQPSNYPSSDDSAPQFEEIIVTATKRTSRNSSSKSTRKNRAQKQAVLAAERTSPSEIDNTYRTSEEPIIPILRADSSYQVFKHYGVNPTISTQQNKHSTFAMDVDTASYQITSSALHSNRLPVASAIRVEEFVNSFSYSYGSTDDVFSVSAEVTPSPYRPGYHLLHVGIKAKHIPDQERLPANIVLIADVSGSMLGDNKMELQKQALTTLVSQLSAKDTVAIVSYSDRANLLLKPTKASLKSKIYKKIQRMQAGGSTNAEQGLQLGYSIASEIAYPGYVNRVVLTSDGMANVGNVDPKPILKKIEDYRKENIFLTTVGVGQSMYNDYLLEQLANKGNGHYLYFANQNDIQRTFVDGLTSQLQVVAKDAKVQLTFNPERVSMYRQIGYENRSLKTQDFLDANKDGGEVGANQQVTALYEIKLIDAAGAEDVANVALSYKKPQGSKVLSLSKPIPASVIRAKNTAASSGTVISMAVAAFAEKLRQSYWSRTYDYQQIQSQLLSLPSHVKRSEEITELRSLINQAMLLDSREDPYANRLPITNIDYDRVPLLR